ncbi:hypothetical protein AB0900_30340 [Streptomyces cellulosae]|nr:hypothetical protein OH709_00665 [Streptomyces cellulosae]
MSSLGTSIRSYSEDTATVRVWMSDGAGNDAAVVRYAQTAHFTTTVLPGPAMGLDYDVPLLIFGGETSPLLEFSVSKSRPSSASLR